MSTSWQSSTYASDLAALSNGGFNPKSRFLFKVKFLLTPEALTAAANLGGFASNVIADLTFTVKKIDLPTVTYEHEDANYYNFKTKILKTIKYSDLGFVFYDEVGNRSIDFFNMVLQLLMPITRSDTSARSLPEDQGFQVTQLLQQSTSNRWVFDTSVNILDSIIIEHFYMSSGGAPELNRYTFTNPRIGSMNIDGLDHEPSSNPNFIDSKFEFDALHILTSQPVSSSETSVFTGADIMKDTVLANFNSAGRFRNQSGAESLFQDAASPSRLPVPVTGDQLGLTQTTAFGRDNFSPLSPEGFGFGGRPMSASPLQSLMNDPTASLGTMFTGAKSENGGGFKLNTTSVVNNFGQTPGGLGAPDGFFDDLQKQATKKINEFSFSDQVLAPIARNAQNTLRNEITKLRNKPIQALQKAIRKAIPTNKFIPYEVEGNIIGSVLGGINSTVPRQPDFLKDNNALSNAVKNLTIPPPARDWKTNPLTEAERRALEGTTIT